METLKNRLEALLDSLGKRTQTDMRYVAHAGGWFGVGKAGEFLVSFALLAALANWLPAEQYGAYQYILSFAQVLIIFTLPGVSTALVRSVARGKEGALAHAYRVKLKYGFLGSLALFAVAVWYLLHANYPLGISFAVAGVFFSIQNAASTFGNYWIGKKRFDMSARYYFTSTLLSALVIIPTVYFTQNVVYLVSAVFASNALFDFILYKRTLHQVTNSDTDPDLVRYGTNLSVMSAIQRIAQRIDTVLLWHFLGPVQVAVYSFGILPIEKLISAVPIGQLALPKLSERSVVDRKHSILRKFWILVIAFVPITALAALVAPPLYQLVFPRYVESIIYVQVFSVLLLFVPFTLLESGLTADMRTRQLYVINTISPIIKIVLLLILIPVWGIWGAVVAVFSEQVVSRALTFYYFLRM